MDREEEYYYEAVGIGGPLEPPQMADLPENGKWVGVDKPKVERVNVHWSEGLEPEAQTPPIRFNDEETDIY